MPKFQPMVDMSYDDADGYDMGPSLLSKPSHPPGLCITLTEREMQMLDLDSPDDVGDLVHLNCIARVTRIEKTDSGCMVSAQITDVMVLENESEEDGEEEEDEEGD
jgi:hypothetical protein